MDDNDREDSPASRDSNASPPSSPASLLKRKRSSSPDGSSMKRLSQSPTPPPAPCPSQVSLSPGSPVPYRLPASPTPPPAPRLSPLDDLEYSPRTPSPLHRSMSASPPDTPTPGKSSSGFFLLLEPLNSSPPAFQPLPLLSLPSRPSQERPFKLPSLPTCKRQKQLDETPAPDDCPTSRDIEGRRVREDTPAPQGPADAGDRPTGLPTQKPGTPAPFSGSSPLSLPPVSPKPRSESAMSSDSVSSRRSVIPLSSPFSRKEARRVRRSIPWLSPRAANRGARVYAPVPIDRSTLIADASNIGERVRERDEGVGRIIEGSTNGRYLKHVRDHFQRIAESEFTRQLNENDGVKRVKMLLEEVDGQRSSWGRTVHRLQHLATNNTSTWMNETWGPPIKDAHGRRLRLARTRGPMEHPSLTKRLSAQYSGGKVSRMSTHSKSVSAERMQKKRHRRFTSPASPGINCVRPEGSAKDAEPATSGKRLVLRGPRPEVPKAQTCSRCGKVCGPMIQCSKCGRTAFCSEQCEKNHQSSFCCAACQREYARFYQDPDEQSQDQAAISDLQNLSIVDDPANYIFDSDHDVDMDDEEDDVEDERLVPTDDKTIVDHKISGRGRILVYQIEKTTRPKTRSWIDANLLYGPRWTEKMHTYWYLDEYRCLMRALVENPDYPDHRESGPFGRFIVGVELEAERDIQFNVREFQRLDQSNRNADWRTTEGDLESEWDEAIVIYWRRVKAAVSWHEREQMVKDMVILPPPTVRNDSVTKQGPGHEEHDKARGS